MKLEIADHEPNHSRAKPSAHDGHAALCRADRHRDMLAVSVMRDLYIIIINDRPVIDASGSVIYYPSRYDADQSKPMGAKVMSVADRQSLRDVKNG